jgi:hypothetical protein
MFFTDFDGKMMTEKGKTLTEIDAEVINKDFNLAFQPTFKKVLKEKLSEAVKSTI